MQSITIEKSQSVSQLGLHDNYFQ